MPVLDEQERADLVAADHDLSSLQHALEAAANSDALDEELIERLKSTAEEIVDRVNRRLPPHIDADARDEIRRRLIDLLVLRPTPGVQLLDLADKALIEAEAVRHVVRDLLQEQPPVDIRDAAAVVTLLEEWLPGVKVHELSQLLGLSDRQLQRRRTEHKPSSYRMQIVLKLVSILRNGWTDRGVYAWFFRARPELAEEAPFSLLDDPARERDLVLAARSGRVQGGF